MKLRLSDKGDRKNSDLLYNYLIDYLNDCSSSLRNKNCDMMAQAIEINLASVRTQYAQAKQKGLFLEGWI